jgi:hypothetical protein
MTGDRAQAVPSSNSSERIARVQDQKQNVGDPHRSGTIDRLAFFVERGWVPIPIRPESKIPLIGWRDILSVTLDVAMSWAQWPNADIGILCGASNLCVVDIDPRNGGTMPAGLPETLTANTPSGGTHLYFRGMTRSGKLIPGVDVKSARSLVVAPSGKDGRSWVSPEVPIADVPQYATSAPAPSGGSSASGRETLAVGEHAREIARDEVPN